jgi:hypothetical protein
MCLNETYRKVHIGKNLFDSFPIQNVLKQGVALSPLLLSFALEYAIMKLQEIHVKLNLNWTHYILAYADDVNLLRGVIDTTEKNTETFIYASKEVGLEIYTGQNWDIKIAKR